MNAFETLREQVPVGRLVESSRGGNVRCVASGHPDNDPSMRVYDDHVHCFGCGFHGDVVDVWAEQKGFEQPIDAAVDLAREFGVELPEGDPEARQKAQDQRKKEYLYLEQASAFHRELSRHPHVLKWWEGRGFDGQLQARFLLGSNKGGTEATLPFWHRGRIKGIIRRPLEGGRKYLLPEAEEFPEGHRPLFIPGPLQNGSFLTEGYIDALAVVATGRSVVAVGGTNISDAQRAQLQRVLREDAKLYILTDADHSGALAAREWGREFFPAAKVCASSYGEGAKDIADTFAREGSEKTGEHLMRLMASSKDMIDIEAEAAAQIEGGPREKLAYATENIVPLLARVSPAGMQDATADIVVDQVKGLKRSWLTKAIKDESERLFGEQMVAYRREREEEFRRRGEEYRQRVEEAQSEIDALIGETGVLGRLRDIASAMHHVYGDREPLELALLVALGAQLEPLPNGRPLGASILLTAEAGRGKNHIVDAAVKPLPPEFVFAFEIASGQSLYYAADEDPDFLRHTFAYPNEIEGAKDLWEFLRPMLSKGWAKKIVTAKDPVGNMTTRTIIVQGPVTIAIPTIRNKTDEQLQTRLLVAELTDYPGRVKHHAAAVSEQLLPDAAAIDHSHEQWLWQEGLRQLTGVRRVIFPLRHPDFALDDDQVSHGARLWANLLSLMATHAWLEQRNRRLLELRSGEVAIEAVPDDYAAAYRIFTRVCKRTVVNLSDTHRKILGALYDLHQEFPNRQGFTQREIAKGAGVSQSQVSDNKTFLVMSVKLMKETDAGLALVEGAEPTWWAEGDLMNGLPAPEKVYSWWEDRDPLPEGSDYTDHADHPDREGHNPHTYAGSDDQLNADQSPISNQSPTPEGKTEPNDADLDRQMIGTPQINENGIAKPKTSGTEDMIGAISRIGGSEPTTTKDNSRLTDEQVREYRRLVGEGKSEEFAAAAVRGEEVEL